MSHIQGKSNPSSMCEQSGLSPVVVDCEGRTVRRKEEGRDGSVYFPLLSILWRPSVILTLSMTIIMPCHHIRSEAHVPQYTQAHQSRKLSQPTRHQKEKCIERLGTENMRHNRMFYLASHGHICRDTETPCCTRCRTNIQPSPCASMA
jgi:hypothetical protein